MRTNRRRRVLTTLGLCIACSVAVGMIVWRAYGMPTVPQGIAYSGELLNNGAPDNALHSFTFDLLDNGGNVLCSDAARAVTVTAGRFDVANLFSGNCSLDTIFAMNTGLQLRITVDNTVLMPMQPLGTVPFAARARVAEVAENLEVPEVPSGAVMYFNLQACPPGWSALVAAQGRYLVGLPAGGTLGGSDGTPLADKEDRPAGQHNHALTDPGHSHPYVAGWGAGENWGLANPGPWGGGQTTGASTTGITIANFGAVAGTNAPYLQLLVCQKN